MGSAHSKAVSRIQQQFDDIINKHKEYQAELSSYIFDHVDPHSTTVQASSSLSSSSSSSSSSSVPVIVASSSSSSPSTTTARLRQKFFADFIEPNGKFSAEFHSNLQHWLVTTQSSLSSAEVQTAIHEGIQAQAAGMQSRLQSEADQNQHQQKEKEIQNELKKTWDELEF